MCDPCYPCYSYSCKSCTKFCHTGSCRCCKCRPCGRTHSKCPYCTSSCYSCHGSEDVQILDENGKPIECKCDCSPCDCCPCPCCCCCRPPEPKEIPVKKCKSRELRASVLYISCDCVKHNGLQDQCRRRDCRDKSECTMKPLPICCPSDKPMKLMFQTMGMTCYQKNNEGSRGKRCKIPHDDDLEDDEAEKDKKSLMCCVACFPGAGTPDACKFDNHNDHDDDKEGWIACKPYCCT